MTGDSSAGTAALAVDGVSHAFGKKPVLKSVSFIVAPGDFTVLLGLNGAGKTTLFALITRLYDTKQGHIRVYGHDMRGAASAALARMGVVFQQSTLDLDLSVEQNLYYHASLHGLARSKVAARIADELTRVGLFDRRGDKARNLSGGQRRRVELARALIHDPALLLMDEPTVGLDIESRQFLLDHVRKLCAEQRLAVLWATHLIDEATDDSKVVVLHKGEVLAQGPSPEVVARSDAADLRGAFDKLVRGSTATPVPA